jgi:hypothetical protein
VPISIVNAALQEMSMPGDRLSDSDRSKLMGGTLKKVYGW